MPRIAIRQNRAPGEYLSNDVAAPVRGVNQATMYRVVLDLAAADLADTTLTMSVALEGSTDGGTTWTIFAKIEGWQGGTVGRDGQITPPRLSWMASDNRTMTRVRVRWQQSKTASVGATLDTTAVDVSSARGV